MRGVWRLNDWLRLVKCEWCDVVSCFILFALCGRVAFWDLMSCDETASSGV